MDRISELQRALKDKPLAEPKLFAKEKPLALLPLQEKTSSVADQEEIQALFPKTYGKPLLKLIEAPGKENFSIEKVGVVFSGGQASGGHNVIIGLYEGLKRHHADSTLIGFLGGPQGILDGDKVELTGDLLKDYYNQGGFDLIGSGRTKIETKEQLEAAKKTALKEKLTGLVVIGGDDSNTNAAMLAEYFLQENVPCTVVGVPKTIDGDLQNEQVLISFGFDTACRVYAEQIGNIARDCLSAKKYYHFIRVMGRSASHIALECALQTHPNIAFISEEIKEKGLTLKALVNMLVEVICKRSEQGKSYGVVVLPEGLIEFIPDFRALIDELNRVLAQDDNTENIEEKLSQESRLCLSGLPEDLRKQLLLDRDPHGNVQVSHIETEKLFIALVKKALKEKSSFQGKFNAVAHFFGYEGRCAYPSYFDAHYAYALGISASALIVHDCTGYMSQVINPLDIVEEWECGGVPITMMLNMEERKGKQKPVIKKALVSLEDKAFKKLERVRELWSQEDLYRYPGPIQYFGPKEVIDLKPLSLKINHF